VELSDGVMQPEEFIQRSERALRQPDVLDHIHSEQRFDMERGVLNATADIWLRADGAGRMEDAVTTTTDDGVSSDEQRAVIVLSDGELGYSVVQLDDEGSSSDEDLAEAGDCLGLPAAPGFDLLGCSGYAPLLFHAGDNLTSNDDTDVAVTAGSLDGHAVFTLTIAARDGNGKIVFNADAATFMPLSWHATFTDDGGTLEATASFTAEAIPADAMRDACFDTASIGLLRADVVADIATVPADSPVYWLGPNWPPTGDAQPLALTRVVPGCRRPTHIAYGAGGFEERLSIETWTRDDWDAWWGDVIVDDLQQWPCVTATQEPFRDGVATIYASPDETFSEDPAGLCPGKPINHYFAIIQMNDTVVVVDGPRAEDTPDGFYPPNGAIPTRAAMDNILAQLQRR
jgi:hypothetical protein